jgi:hypothetical protein
MLLSQINRITVLDEGCTTLAGILDCFGRASLAMTRECLTTKSFVPSLRGTKQSRRKKHAWTYNNDGCWSLFIAGILDCFGRASLAMTSARVMTNECLIMNSRCPSLRGTKQSRIMKQEETYNNEGRRSLCAGILDCFGRASLAMTAGGKNNCQLIKSCSS